MTFFAYEAVIEHWSTTIFGACNKEQEMGHRASCGEHCMVMINHKRRVQAGTVLFWKWHASWEPEIK